MKILVCCSLLALLPTAARAAQAPAPAPEQQEPEPEPPAPPEAGPEPDAGAILAEIRELIEKVREDFLAVDRRLDELQDLAADAASPERAGPPAPAGADAGTGEGTATAPPAPPLGEGLAAAVAEADRLLADMEELLAKLPASDSPSGGGGGGRSSQGEGRNRPCPKGRQDQPEDGGRDEKEPEEQDGGRPPLQALNELLSDLAPGAWGSLPVRLQEALQNATAEELPPRYRRWIERYHRRPVDSTSRR